MAKKYFGKIITLAAIAGATTAAVSYFLKYKSFNKELEEDFHDFEDDLDDFQDGKTEAPAERNYVSLNAERPAETAADSEQVVAEEVISEKIHSEVTEAVSEEATPPTAEEPIIDHDTTTIVEDTTE